MKKTFNVDSTYNNMRIDRWVRNNIGNIPQGFIERNLRNGKIKLNKKKIKVISFNSLTTDLCKKYKSNIILSSFFKFFTLSLTEFFVPSILIAVNDPPYLRSFNLKVFSIFIIQPGSRGSVGKKAAPEISFEELIACVNKKVADSIF